MAFATFCKSKEFGREGFHSSASYCRHAFAFGEEEKWSDTVVGNDIVPFVRPRKRKATVWIYEIDG